MRIYRENGKIFVTGDPLNGIFKVYAFPAKKDQWGDFDRYWYKRYSRSF